MLSNTTCLCENRSDYSRTLSLGRSAPPALPELTPTKSRRKLSSGFIAGYDDSKFYRHVGRKLNEGGFVKKVENGGVL